MEFSKQNYRPTNQQKEKRKKEVDTDKQAKITLQRHRKRICKMTWQTINLLFNQKK